MSKQPKPITLETITGEPEEPALAAAVLSAPDLLALDIPPRPKLLGNWFREGDFGYLYAPRGHGKSWLSMLLGSAIASGSPLGDWAAGEGPRPVLYVDSEMNLPDVQDRARLIGIDSARFRWLQFERVFDALERSLNIQDPGDQDMLSELVEDGSILIIDNLSTSSSGAEENNNDHFDLVKSWLLSLRRRGVSVLLIHHAGRNGQMRGASRREDMAHWIVSLKNDGDGEATSFVTVFQKCRNCPLSDAPPLRWTLDTRGGQLTYTCERHSGVDALYGLIVDGVESCSDLAEELGVSKGTISKWCKKLLDVGRIKKKGRGYVPADPTEDD